MKSIAEHCKGRFSTFLFSMLSTASFFGGALVILYVMFTGQDDVIGNLLAGHFRTGSHLTDLLGGFLGAGVSCFVMALIFDFMRRIRVVIRDQPSSLLEVALRLVKPLFLSDVEQENLVGDLIEEFSQFSSRTNAYLWVFKQVLKSSWQLAGRAVKYKILASIEAWIRRKN